MSPQNGDTRGGPPPPSDATGGQKLDLVISNHVSTLLKGGKIDILTETITFHNLSQNIGIQTYWAEVSPAV